MLRTHNPLEETKHQQEHARIYTRRCASKKRPCETCPKRQARRYCKQQQSMYTGGSPRCCLETAVEPINTTFYAPLFDEIIELNRAARSNTEYHTKHIFSSSIFQTEHRSSPTLYLGESFGLTRETRSRGAGDRTLPSPPNSPSTSHKRTDHVLSRVIVVQAVRRETRYLRACYLSCVARGSFSADHHLW